MSEGERLEKHEWLKWSRELLSIAQAGLTYSKNDFDLERFRKVKEISEDIAAEGSGEPFERVKSLFEQETGYQTPKVDVRGAIFKDGMILLVPELLDGGKWTLPGGWGEPWSTPHENVEREVAEETGLIVKAVKLAGVYDRAKQGHTPSFHNSYRLFFICDIVDGELRASNETGLPEFFAERDIPAEENISLTRMRRHLILRMFEHYRNPQLPTDFD